MKGGKCRKTNVIYKAKIVIDNNINIYIRLSSNEIKKEEQPVTMPQSIVNRTTKTINNKISRYINTKRKI